MSQLQGQFAESEKLYLKAIAVVGKALYWSNLGVLYHRWDKLDQAEAAYSAALQLDSHLDSARNNLRRLRNKQRK